jgi:hypothetical protein
MSPSVKTARSHIPKERFRYLQVFCGKEHYLQAQIKLPNARRGGASMRPDQPARFRSSGSLGANGLNDLRFNELGGTRVPGATGSKTRPPSGPLSPGFLLAPDDVSAAAEAVYGALPDAGPPASGATDTGTSASPNPYLPVLSPTERKALWDGILRGDKYEETLWRAKIWMSGNTLPLEQMSLVPESHTGEPHLVLLEGSLVNSLDIALINEVTALHREYQVMALTEFWELNEPIAKQFKVDPKDLQPGQSPDAWRNYCALRHLYFKAGYTHPPTELNKIIPYPDFTFLGSPVVGGVHPELADILKDAQNKLTGTGPLALNAPLKLNLCSFVPRPISDDKANLSNHAIGKAIDINPDTNPQFSKAEATTIDKVLGWLKLQKTLGAPWLLNYNLSGPYPFSKSLDAACMADGSTLAYREMEQNSAWIQAFLREMYPMRQKLKTDSDKARKYLKDKKLHPIWKDPNAAPAGGGDSSQSCSNQSLPMEDPEDLQARLAVETSENLEQLIGALARATPPVKPEKAIKFGVLTLPPQLFAAMADAGARSGLDPAYQHKKDAMHFEVPSGRKGKKSATGAHP